MILLTMSFVYAGIGIVFVYILWHQPKLCDVFVGLAVSAGKELYRLFTLRAEHSQEQASDQANEVLLATSDAFEVPTSVVLQWF